MRLTNYIDYALRTLIYVTMYPDGLVTIQHIADAFDIPENHLIKIVQQFRQDGFLHTVRGRAGSTALGRPTAEVNLDDMIRATKPGFRMAECFHDDDNYYVITRVCGLRGVLHTALRTYSEVLDGYTLQDLVNRPNAASHALGGAPLSMPCAVRRKGVAAQTLIRVAVTQH